MHRPTLLVVSQVYVPDPASVGQHMADVAVAMVKRGWRVVVVTAARGYDEPSVRYARREVLDGVEVVRCPLSSFGKRSIPVRLAAHALFLLQALVRGAATRGLRCVLISTSPPAAPVAGWALSVLRRVPVKFWVMDLNPDQLVASGRLPRTSFLARAFDALNRLILRRASDVVVLDRFMAERVRRKLDVAAKLTVLPPWPHAVQLQPAGGDENPFRRQHGLVGKVVVMYSGNHSPANPLSTLLEAARRLRDDERFVFVFIGGGLAKVDVETARRAGGSNIRSLPYQPLDALGASLSAADVHVVTLGDPMVGIVHPCKIYGAMSVGRPLLTFGPTACHLAELVRRFQLGFHVAHGDVQGAVSALRALSSLSPDEAARIGRRGLDAIASELSAPRLCTAFCRVVERGTVADELRGAASGRRHERRVALRIPDPRKTTSRTSSVTDRLTPS